MRTSQGIYALNGKAVGKVNNSKSDVTDKTFQEIWLDDSTMKGFKITLPPEFIKQGLENCK
jgi:sporulation protein YlmC with PRC-barrel domain